MSVLVLRFLAVVDVVEHQLRNGPILVVYGPLEHFARRFLETPYGLPVLELRFHH